MQKLRNQGSTSRSNIKIAKKKDKNLKNSVSQQRALVKKLGSTSKIKKSNSILSLSARKFSHFKSFQGFDQTPTSKYPDISRRKMTHGASFTDKRMLERKGNTLRDSDAFASSAAKDSKKKEK